MSHVLTTVTLIKNLLIGAYNALLHPLFTAPTKRANGTITLREKIHCIRAKVWCVFVLVALVFPASGIVAFGMLVLSVDLVVLLASIISNAVLRTALESTNSPSTL